MRRPRLHLISNAHLDPVWQWRWEEGAAEAIATFGTAAVLLREHKKFIFNHNEAILYRWVERYDPALFEEIRALVKQGRWSISGGWYLQPDLNMPGLESLVRQIAEGRRYFWEKFRVRPRVAYNFDSFGHSGGLPQILRLAEYKMYIHLRPQSRELHLPSDLYRWRGVDGSEILTLRIGVGLYHTERDNIEERLRQGTELALKLERDVPVFWGLGNHGGGATREDLRKIDRFAARENRVEVIHSTPDRLYEALREEGRKAPVVGGDLQRVFTGCYSSMARLKRRGQESLGALIQAETLGAAAWWLAGQAYPRKELREAWRDHLLNDFHDILTGSSTEPAERDALDLYGKVAETARRLRLGAAASFARLRNGRLSDAIPIAVLNANPSLAPVPVEVEAMADYRPFWKGEWHLRLFGLGGRQIVSQEEQPESLLPFNGWRRKLCFLAELPGVGCSFFTARAFRGRKKAGAVWTPKHELRYRIDRNSSLITFLDAGRGRPCLRGPLLEPLVMQDKGDSWGTGLWRYRDIAGRFVLERGSYKIIKKGPVRTIRESVLTYNKSRIIFHIISYPSWPVLEFRLRLHWNEERKMLKLAVPTVFGRDSVLCEVPGGAIYRPADGKEHVFGRWALVEGKVKGCPTALAVIASGQHGLDFADGELRLSVLRSAAYCQERGFRLEKSPARRYMDQGVHDVRLLVTAGDAEDVRLSLAGLADWLSAPPFALAHLPFGEAEALTGRRRKADDQKGFRSDQGRRISLFSLAPASIRMTACKPSWEGKALIIRLHEAIGRETAATLKFNEPGVVINLLFKPFEIKTIRLEKTGRWREVGLINET
jgi:alpha-mannosidase